MILTIWTKGDLMQVCQLSDDPADGTATEQIAQIGNAGFAGWTCISENYTGTFPETDSSTWYWDGNTVSAKQPTQAEVFKQYDIAIELYLDAKAKAAGYYDPLDRIPAIDRACAYAGFTNPYQTESQFFVLKRAAVWAYVYDELAKVQAGTRPLPTPEELSVELDTNVWNVA